MSCYLFRLLDGCSIFEAKKELQNLGLHDLYFIEDDSSGEVLIGGMAKSIDIDSLRTCLMLELMKGCVSGEIILDLGCGSGILSLAALMMGAKRAHGIDIDPAAIAHARQNTILNHLEKWARFSEALPKFSAKPVILINMIFTEQQILISENPDLPKRAKLWITSGILKNQRKKALSFLSGLDLQIIEEAKRGEWIGFKGKPLPQSEGMAQK